MENEGLTPVRDEIVHLMRGIDIDGTNTIDYNVRATVHFRSLTNTVHRLQEFLAATMEVNHAIREENIRRAFHHFDREGTGNITMADLVRVMGSEQHAQEIVGECKSL
jgi:Ca2+-binding EF-hand superfamily protein